MIPCDFIVEKFGWESENLYLSRVSGKLECHYFMSLHSFRIKSFLFRRIEESIIAENDIWYYVYYIRGYPLIGGDDVFIYEEYYERTDDYPENGITAFVKTHYPEILLI